jgi:tetratricopeptide (TPR) repeat protein
LVRGHVITSAQVRCTIQQQKAIKMMAEDGPKKSESAAPATKPVAPPSIHGATGASATPEGAHGDAKKMDSDRPSNGSDLFGPLKPVGKTAFGKLDRQLTAASISALIVIVFIVGSQAWVQAHGGGNENWTRILNLLMIGAAAFGLGMFAGFIFGAVGDEKQSFSGISSIINGAIGGFALGDLTKKDSFIKAVLHSLAQSCGLGTVGLVASVLAFFGSTGFILMYTKKQYLLNPDLSRKQQMADQNEKVTLLTRSIKVSQTDIGAVPQIEKQTREKIETALKDFENTLQKDPELVDLFSIEILKSYAKAYYTIEAFGKAEAMLRRARNLVPDDTESLFYLSHVLITDSREVEAIPYLAFLAGTRNAPVLTWKLLGYACLFVPCRLDESERASGKYLCFCAEDAGALVNLACVYGQRGPADSANITKAVEYLKKAISLEPELRKLIKEKLTEQGQDFSAWKDIKEFQDL